MTGGPSYSRLGHFMLLTAAFIVATLSMSNLMSLVLQVAVSGLTTWSGLTLVGYISMIVLSIAYLARAMYRLDKKAGRIRNRVGWFE